MGGSGRKRKESRSAESKSHTTPKIPSASACEGRRRVDGVPVIAEPVAAPDPPLDDPDQAPDVQVVERVAVDGTPEKDGLALLGLRYELRVCEEEV